MTFGLHFETFRLQHSQLEEQQTDYPLDYVMRDLKTCGPRKSAVPALNDAHHLQADTVRFYGELGQLSSYCPSNYTLLQKGERWGGSKWPGNVCKQSRRRIHYGNDDLIIARERSLSNGTGVSEVHRSIIPSFSRTALLITSLSRAAKVNECSRIPRDIQMGIFASFAGILGQCDLRSSEMKLPSLPAMLELRGAKLERIYNNQLDESLADQARLEGIQIRKPRKICFRDIGESIRKVEGYQDHWKMILILATIQDGKASETGQTAVEVLAAIEELGKLVPEKTFVVVLRTSGSGIWRDASHQSLACKSQLAQWKVHNKFNYNSVWDQVRHNSEIRTVVFCCRLRSSSRKTTVSHSSMWKCSLCWRTLLWITCLTGEVPTEFTPTQLLFSFRVDLSVLGYDCAHFSERGLSLLHLSIWNALFTRNSARESQYRPTASQVLCPDPTCPFFRTPANSDMCIWTGTMVSWQFNICLSGTSCSLTTSSTGSTTWYLSAFGSCWCYSSSWFFTAFAWPDE